VAGKGVTAGIFVSAVSKRVRRRERSFVATLLRTRILTGCSVTGANFGSVADKGVSGKLIVKSREMREGVAANEGPGNGGEERWREADGHETNSGLLQRSRTCMITQKYLFVKRYREFFAHELR
jgi:hypothetical protein